MRKMKSRSSSNITLDKKRARHVLHVLYEAYSEGKQLFAHVARKMNAPQQKFFPHGVAKGGIEHCRWLFFAAMTDRREVSETVYESHVRLWKREPQLYSAQVLDMPAHEITLLLAEGKIGSPGQSARYWPRSARTLFESFGGDPLAIYRELGSINDILAFKSNGKGNILPGFGPKILSLLSLFYEELGLMSMPPDAFPVDVHVQRFAISTGIVTAKTSVTNEEVESELRPLLCEICKEERWEPLELSHALWFLGNRCCSGCYRNAAAERLCPSYGMCGGSISTLSYFRRGFWDMTAPRHRKGGECLFSLPESPLFSL